MSSSRSFSVDTLAVKNIMHMENLSKVIVGLLILVLISCNKDDEFVDETPPTISFGSGLENTTLWNTVDVTLTATDNQILEKIDIFAGTVLIETLTTTPYEFQWDTKTVSDGSHTLKAVATDQAGNEATETVDVEIYNKLLEIEIEAGKFAETDEIYYFITKDNGEIVGAALELADGQSGSIERPETFDDEKFNFHRIRYISLNKFDLESYIGIKYGKIVERSTDFFNTGDQLGAASVTFSDIPTHERYSMVYGNGFIIQAAQLGANISVPIYENANDLYLYLNQGEQGLYQYFNDLNVDQNYEFFLSNMNANMTKITLSPPSSDFNIQFARVFVYDVENDFNSNLKGLFVNIQINPVPEMSFHLPNDIPEHKSYKLGMIFKNGTSNSYNFNYYGTIPTEVPPFNFDLQTIGTDINNNQVNTTGTYDYIRDNWASRNSDRSEQKRWNIFSEGGSDASFPQIPQTVLSKHAEITLASLSSNETNTRSVDVINYSHLEDFDAVIDRILLRNEKTILDGIEFSQQISQFTDR